MAWSLVYTAALAGVVLWKEHLGWKLFWPAATIALLVVVVLHVRAFSENTIVQVRSFYGTLRVTEETRRRCGHVSHADSRHHPAWNAVLEQRRAAPGTQPPTTRMIRVSGWLWTSAAREERGGLARLDWERERWPLMERRGMCFAFMKLIPRVEAIARNTFTYLRDSKARIEIAHGDARLSMEAEPPEDYDVIAVDAFSGDAIPVHLLTAEAIQLYQRHLRPGGIIAFHISNLYLNLAPVVKATGRPRRAEGSDYLHRGEQRDRGLQRRLGAGNGQR